MAIPRSAVFYACNRANGVVSHLQSFTFDLKQPTTYAGRPLSTYLPLLFNNDHKLRPKRETRLGRSEIPVFSFYDI